MRKGSDMLRRLISSLLLITALAAHPAGATLVTGSYTGSYDHATFMGNTRYPGTPASGSVLVDTSYFSPTGGDGVSFIEYVFFSVDPEIHAMTFTRDSEDGHWSSYGGSQTIRLVRGGAFDTLYFGAYFPGGGYGSSIRLVGAAGSLFTDLSLDAIVPGSPALDLSLSRDYQGNYLEDSYSYGSEYRFNSFSLSVEPMPAVPEPASISLLALGLGALVVMRCRSC
jgi:hypothetical protein